MANFRIFPGKFINIPEPIKSREGRILYLDGAPIQVLSLRPLTFVGVNGSFEIKNLRAIPVEPE